MMKQHDRLVAVQPYSLGWLVFVLASTCLFLALLPLIRAHASKPASQKQPIARARLDHEHVSVQAAGRGNPTINLNDGRELLTSYVGPPELQAALEQNNAQPLTLAAADFDED